MSDEVEFTEESLKRIAEQKVNYRFAVKIHATAYIGTIILLAVINIVFDPSFLWFIIAALGWWIGLVIHAAEYLMWANGVYAGKKALVLHLLAWIFGSLLLLAINYLTAGTIDWALIPIPCWFAGLIAHTLIWVSYTRKSDEAGDKKSRKERAVERELEKMRAKMKK